METYDVVMLAILIGATLWGAFKGFAWQVASIASLFVSYWVAFHFRDQVSPLVSTAPPWNMFSAMLILFGATSSAIWLVFQLLAGVIGKLRLNAVDRQMGAILGLGKGIVICVLATLFSVTLLGESARQSIIHSKSGHKIALLIHDADAVMPPEIKSVVAPYLEDFDRQMDPDAASNDTRNEVASDGEEATEATADADDGSARTAWQRTERRLEKSFTESVQKGIEDGVRKRFSSGKRE